MFSQVARVIRAVQRRGSPAPGSPAALAYEVNHWNEIELKAHGGKRLFWTQQPRVAWHYLRKSLIDGMLWQQWIPHVLGRPGGTALELGCGGNGLVLASLLRDSTARKLVGVDLDEKRFASARSALGDRGKEVRFVAADVNNIRLEKSAYEVICAVQAFHHFENLEHVFAEIDQALCPGGFCVLDEYVGPARFQWTDTQLSLTAHLLGMLPPHLRQYSNGKTKTEEKRDRVEDVIRGCPSEAIRSDEIVPLFYKTFDVVHHKNLGGTIQNLLYTGIIHNFPDDDPETDRLIDSVEALESAFISHEVIGSDFALLVGRKKPAKV